VSFGRRCPDEWHLRPLGRRRSAVEFGSEAASRNPADAYYQAGVERGLRSSEHWTVKDCNATSGE
jgi:hypothetical protein